MEQCRGRTGFRDREQLRSKVDDGFNTISYEDPQRVLSHGTLASTYVAWYNSSTHTCTTPNLGTLTFNDYRNADLVYNNGLKWTVPASPGRDTCKSGCTSFPPRKAQYDIDGIAVHEVGHGLGLDHSVNPADTMYGSVGACDCAKQSVTSCDSQTAQNLCYCLRPEQSGGARAAPLFSPVSCFPRPLRLRARVMIAAAQAEGARPQGAWGG